MSRVGSCVTVCRTVAVLLITAAFLVLMWWPRLPSAPLQSAVTGAGSPLCVSTQGTRPSSVPFALAHGPSPAAAAGDPYHSIADLARRHLTDPAELHPAAPFFDNLYEFRVKQARLVVPDGFAPIVRKMFASFPAAAGQLRHVEEQSIVTVFNKWSLEYTMFNELRKYRPGYQDKLAPSLEAKVREMYMGTAGPATCDFCSVERTAVDPWGRLRGKHCYVASNVAKYEAQHALLVAHQHDTLNVTSEAFEDYMQVAFKWFEAAHTADPTARYPHIMWDAGGRASASQPHLHMQMSILHRYYTRAALAQDAAERYHVDTGRGYWQDVVAAHEALGLAVRYGSCALVSSITPVKEREIIVVAPSGRLRCFARLLTLVVNTLVEDLGVRSFSGVILPEPIGATAGGYPALARFIDRGSPLDTRNDMGAMEMFGGFNVVADPYNAIPHLKLRAKALPPL